jgi:hypothetical protein
MTLYLDHKEEVEEGEQTIDKLIQMAEETKVHGQTQWTINTIIQKIQQEREETKANDPKAKIQTLTMKGLHLDQYIKDFENLAE